MAAFLSPASTQLSGGRQFLPNWHVEAMAYELSEVMRGRTRRLIITVPPRSLKSICASVALPAFALGHESEPSDYLRQLFGRAGAQAC